MPPAHPPPNPSTSPQPSQPNNALDSFRSEWLREVNQRQQSTPHPPETQPPPQPSTSSSQPSHEHKLPSTLASPLSIYASAVCYERVGLLDDALVYYRRAFRLEPDIDRIYQNLNPDQIEWLERRALVNHSTEHPPCPLLKLSASFSQTQIQDEYVAPSIPSNPLVVARTKLSNLDLPLDRRLEKKEITPNDDDSLHPRSTKRFLHSLLASFQAHPWQRDRPHSEELDDHNHQRYTTINHDPSTYKNTDDQIGQDVKEADYGHSIDQKQVAHKATDLPSPVSIGLQFEPLDVEGQSLLQRVPLELIIKMLTALTLRRSTIHLAISAVEAFAQVCRFSRILTLQNFLWRSICETIYTNDLFINQEQHKIMGLLGSTSSSEVIKFKSKIDFVHRLCTKCYGLDWRRMFIEQF